MLFRSNGFLVKWWDNFRFKEIIEKIHMNFLPPIQKAITCQTAIAHRTRSQTSLDSVQVSEKSSKELHDLGQQLILHSEQLESAEKNSPTSSKASVGFCPNDPLLQDSQDPYDGYNLDNL